MQRLSGDGAYSSKYGLLPFEDSIHKGYFPRKKFQDFYFLQENLLYAISK